MNRAASSLRLRLFFGVLGAGLFAFAVLAIALLLDVRDGLYARRIADARAQLKAVVTAAEESCASSRACLQDAFAHRQTEGLNRGDAHCIAPTLRASGLVSLCVELPAGAGALHLSVPLGPVRDQLIELDEKMLISLALALAISVIWSLFVFERGVLSRLQTIDVALDALDMQGERELLPEGGDGLGRLGGAVNRLAARLTEERARTGAQIISLQAANRALAEEQAALREARADLMRSERLASVGRLAAGVAHEVGNPISAVIAYAALLTDRLARLERAASLQQIPERAASLQQAPERAASLQQTPERAAALEQTPERAAALEQTPERAAALEQTPERAAALEEAREFAGRIERESARVDRILRDLLDLARPREMRLEPVALAHALSAARALVEPQPLFRHCTFALDLPPDLPPVQGEEHYIVQVLVNLFSNSAQAGATQLRVRARAGLAAESELVILEVEDDGQGISPELLPRLFEPFVTSASPGEGTGLGLALSHATMERIGGSISAAPGVNGGAVFALRFRRSAA